MNPLSHKLKYELQAETKNAKFSEIIRTSNRISMSSHEQLNPHMSHGTTNFKGIKLEKDFTLSNKKPIEESLKLNNRTQSLRKRSYSEKKLPGMQHHKVQLLSSSNDKQFEALKIQPSNRGLSQVELNDEKLFSRRRLSSSASSTNVRLEKKYSVAKQTENKRSSLSNFKNRKKSESKNSIAQPILFAPEEYLQKQLQKKMGLDQAVQNAKDPLNSLVNSKYGKEKGRNSETFRQYLLGSAFDSSKQHGTTINKVSDLMNHLSHEMVLYLKNGEFVKEHNDYSRFMSMIEQKKQSGLISGIKIEFRLKEIHRLIKRFGIHAAVLECNSVIQLSKKQCVSNFERLKCFNNWESIIKHSNRTIPGVVFYYPDEEAGRNLAASKITSLFKMIKSRSLIRNYRSLMVKVVIIQSAWRKCLLKKRHSHKRLKTLNQKLQRNKELQQVLMKNYFLYKSSPKRIEVHVSSLCLETFKLCTLESKSQLENSNLVRIFKTLHEQNLIVVYVTPIQLSADVLKYYQRLFKIAMGTENDEGSNLDNPFHKRVYFVHPQNSERLKALCSGELSTISNLMYSPKALKRIKSILKSSCDKITVPNIVEKDGNIEDVKNMALIPAYIVPAHPSVEYVHLSAELNIPLMAPVPSVGKLLSTKIGFRQVIRPIISSSNVPIFRLPISVDSIFSEKELLNTMALLIFKHQEVKKWYLKIDDEVNTRGLAYFSINSINFLKQINNRANEEAMMEEYSDKELIQMIRAELQQKFKKRLKIVHRNIYSTYAQYISHFLTRGGVIEEAIEGSNDHYGKVQQMTVSFLIEPNGDFEILSTYNKVELNSRAVCSTMRVPAVPTSVDIEKITRHAYRRLFLKLKMYGYFSIDLLVRPGEETPFVIGMDCFLNNRAASIFFLKAISKSSYNKDRNEFQKIKDKFDLDQTMNQSIFGDQQQNLNSSISKSVNGQAVIELDLHSKIENYGGKRETQEAEEFISKTVKFVYCPLVSLLNLESLSEFFKKCKYQNISFDVKSRNGTIFVLPDDLEYENLGLLCCDTREKGLNQEILKVIEYFSKNYRKKRSGKVSHAILRKEVDQIGLLRGAVLSAPEIVGKNKQNKTKQNGGTSEIAPNLDSIF